MEWIKTIFPLVGVLIGWLLSESGKLITDKRQDKRKLKKLLFFLLELRYYFSKEITIENDMDRMVKLMQQKMAKSLGLSENDPQLDINNDTFRQLLGVIIKKNNLEDSRLQYLTENIGEIIIELAEILPIMAYELSGQHDIKARLSGFETYLNAVNSLTDEIPFDFKKWFNPKLTKELLKDLEDSILLIANRIDRKTAKSVKNKIRLMTFDSNDEEINNLVDDYLKEVRKFLNHSKSDEKNLIRSTLLDKI